MAVPEAFWTEKKKLVLFLQAILHRHSKPAFFSSTLTSNINTKAMASDLPGEQPQCNGIGNVNFTVDVRKLCKQNRLKEALHILRLMDEPDFSTYASLLQGCINIKALPEGKLVHAYIIRTRFKLHNCLCTKVLIIYAKCGSLVDARRVLDEMPTRNEASWSAMIAAYARQGNGQEALTLFYEMQRSGNQPNQFTFASVLPACANQAALKAGKEVHASIIVSGFQSDIFVNNALVDMYAKCGQIQDAHHVFDKMPQRNVVSWSAMIAAFARRGHSGEALTLFHQMQRSGIIPDQFAFASVLPACGNMAALEHGKEVHREIIRSGVQADIFVGNGLIDMYAKCESMVNAQRVFDNMPEQNVASWTAMIAGYAQNGYVDEALELFQKMPRRDTVSWNVMIAGLAHNGLVDEAMKLFQKMPEQNAVSWNAMMTGYAQGGHTDNAMKLFQRMPARDVVSWSAMIAIYAQNGHFEEALNLFRQMQLAGVVSNLVTFASVLPACANLAALQQGKEVHEDIIRKGLQYNVFVGSALIDMYAKCGSIKDARTVFNKMPQQNVVSWNSMIVGYAIHGCGKEALQLFEQMQHSGMEPDHITFVGVLSACCHAGLVDDGWQYFDRMSQDYHITPGGQHYCCMVDLLGRAGHLDEAHNFINKMPIKPSPDVWGSLLAACRNHTNIELGERVAERLFELDPENSAHYVLLSNMYARAGRWEDKEKVRKMMKDRRVKKTPGHSWIEVNNKVYAFLVGDRSHPQTREIYAKLDGLFGQMKEAGYTPDMNFVFHDVEDEQKEHTLCHHSEKLAIAFGLINTSPGTPIRIVKNLRVCGDCHSATKFISQIVARDIIVRDAIRFHHFKDGQCSCGGYW